MNRTLTAKYARLEDGRYECRYIGDQLEGMQATYVDAFQYTGDMVFGNSLARAHFSKLWNLPPGSINLVTTDYRPT